MINRIDKSLDRLIMKERERVQINKIRNEKEVTTNTTENHRIIKNYYEQLYTNNMDNWEEMDKFLEMYNVPRLNQEEIENMNRQITSKEIESVSKNTKTQKNKKLPTKVKDWMASEVNSTKHLEKS